ncbi:pyrroline-5-carboxylate reductase [Piscirickettsia litoralis]|uniref:Pyrroline-5-carboxylate reductase n=1 Tax=Piscirickettsia litoralis TaxID=1891921 RepID=A0ABX3A2J2_9GAMM|nr:pyrroline-5-carboxylate reductase [Piscirickettsia litoralis]ODN43099.1 pyrroline-5-carboxylate reductase [Piscirickettsia litoralis]
MQKMIGFIGGGNMTRSLVAGLIADGYPAKNIWVADRNVDKCELLIEQFAIHAVTGINQVIDQVEIVVLSVKPQGLKVVVKEYAELIRQKESLVVSVATGIPMQALQSWFGAQVPVIRAMPNTPALIRSGVTGLYAGENITEQQREDAESLMRAVGLAVWVSSEAEFDALLSLSGCGPAYIFLVIEAMAKAGVKIGLEEKSANLLAIQTTLGAARMALESDEGVDRLRQRVMSKGGATAEGVKVLEQEGIAKMFENTLRAAKERVQQISFEFGQES